MKTLWDTNKKMLVESALHTYVNDPMNTSAGYDILRYTQKGVLGCDVETNIYTGYYDYNDRKYPYEILRLAKGGHLYFNG